MSEELLIKPKPVTLLDQYEKASRIYCTKMGINADAKIKVPHPMFRNGIDKPTWHIIAEDLIDFSMKLTSLREAVEAKPTVQ